ncbi:MAG TPA: HAD hydrolase family protein [Pseudomonadota bacterium]|nr:HAD hydrolase family protein [Pseudomonadota bacterium]
MSLVNDEPAPSPEILARLRPIRLLCLDVDGVLSDGHLYFAGGEGDARFCQRFSVRDGVGIRLLMQSGRHVAILSEGNILSGRVRAESLSIRHAYFGLRDKVAKFSELLSELGLSKSQAAFIGDEVSDLPLLHEVGFAATVPDAVWEVRRAVHHVTTRPGGSGAVREVCDLIRRFGDTTPAGTI